MALHLKSLQPFLFQSLLLFHFQIQLLSCFPVFHPVHVFHWQKFLLRSLQRSGLLLYKLLLLSFQAPAAFPMLTSVLRFLPSLMRSVPASCLLTFLIQSAPVSLQLFPQACFRLPRTMSQALMPWCLPVSELSIRS